MSETVVYCHNCNKFVHEIKHMKTISVSSSHFLTGLDMTGALNNIIQATAETLDDLERQITIMEGRFDVLEHELNGIKHLVNN